MNFQMPILTYFQPYTSIPPENTKKGVFLMLSGVKEMEHWLKMG